MCGCIGPKYNKDYQRVSFKISDGTKLSIKDKRIDDFQGIGVKRSFASLEGTLSKDGFEDKKIEIKSHFTDDKWAEVCGFGCAETSASQLLPPVNTILFTLGGGYAGMVEAPSNILGMGNWGWGMKEPLSHSQFQIETERSESQ